MVDEGSFEYLGPDLVRSSTTFHRGILRGMVNQVGITAKGYIKPQSNIQRPDRHTKPPQHYTKPLNIRKKPKNIKQRPNISNKSSNNDAVNIKYSK